eukprot:297546_1
MGSFLNSTLSAFNEFSEEQEKKTNEEQKHDDDISSVFNWKVINNTDCHVTRYNVKHDLIVGIVEQNKLLPFIRHQSIFFAYFAQAGFGIECRLFMMELFVNNQNENILALNGPNYTTRDYNCTELYFTTATVNDLIEIAKHTMKTQGDYDLIYNNCRHYTKKLLKNIKSKCKPHRVNAEFTWDIIFKYTEKYRVRGNKMESVSEKLISFVDLLQNFPL